MANRFQSTTLANDNSAIEINKAVYDLLSKINTVSSEAGSTITNTEALSDITTMSYFKKDLGNLTGSVLVDWSVSNFFVGSITANTTLVFTNPTITNIRILVANNTVSNYNLTFPSTYAIGVLGATAKVFTIPLKATQSYSMYDVFYDGTRYFVSESKFYL